MLVHQLSPVRECVRVRVCLSVCVLACARARARVRARVCVCVWVYARVSSYCSFFVSSNHLGASLFFFSFLLDLYFVAKSLVGWMPQLSNKYCLGWSCIRVISSDIVDGAPVDTPLAAGAVDDTLASLLRNFSLLIDPMSMGISERSQIQKYSRIFVTS